MLPKSNTITKTACLLMLSLLVAVYSQMSCNLASNERPRIENDSCDGTNLCTWSDSYVNVGPYSCDSASKTCVSLSSSMVAAFKAQNTSSEPVCGIFQKAGDEIKDYHYCAHISQRCLDSEGKLISYDQKVEGGPTRVGKCVLAKQFGDACRFDAECIPSNDIEELSKKSARCLNSICVGGQVGDACKTTQGCALGLFCNTGTQKCQQQAQPGDSCVSVTMAQGATSCVFGYRCDAASNVCILDTWYPKQVLKEGANCAAGSNEPYSVCEEHLFCNKGESPARCRPRRQWGESCTIASNQCFIGGVCVNDLCVDTKNHTCYTSGTGYSKTQSQECPCICNVALPDNPGYCTSHKYACKEAQKAILDCEIMNCRPISESHVYRYQPNGCLMRNCKAQLDIFFQCIDPELKKRGKTGVPQIVGYNAAWPAWYNVDPTVGPAPGSSPSPTGAAATNSARFLFMGLKGVCSLLSRPPTESKILFLLAQAHLQSSE